MKFVFPCMEYERKAIEFIEEFHTHSSEIHGTGSLDRFLHESTYQEWVVKIQKDIDIANISEGKVPALTYFYVRENDGIIVGMINIRLALNDFLRREGGNIGYSVRPTERKKGYATKMLSEALDFCRAIGMSDFLITCHKENPASAGVIKNCGGVLDEEFFSDTYNQVIQRYRIR